jgi:NAD(P)-dependent dehydrogenase (short-subunit alcohol dehydrogenase family)
MKTVLITGAGSGFGLEAAMRLAEKGFAVIASVEITVRFNLSSAWPRRAASS